MAGLSRYTARTRTAEPFANSITVDSLTSDPISELFDTGVGTSRTWTLGARTLPAQMVSERRRRGSQRTSPRGPNGIGEIREIVDGTPARLWTLTRASATDVRRLTTVTGFVNERLALGPSRLTADSGSITRPAPRISQ